MVPTFVSDQPQLVTWAEQLWPAAEGCVGWSPPAKPEVLLTVGDPGSDRPGFAKLSSREGLHTVILREPDDVITLAHELGHAWSHGGAEALAEGRADFVANCALQATRLGPPRHRTVDLAAMEDLTAWTNAEGPKTDARTAGYAAGQQLVLSLANVLTPEELWPVDGTLDWTELDAILEGHGKPGRRVLRQEDRSRGSAR